MNGDLIGACVMITVAVLWIVCGIARLVLDHLATEHEARRYESASPLVVEIVAEDRFSPAMKAAAEAARRWSDGDFRRRWDAMTEAEREAGMEQLLTALREDLPVPWVLSETRLRKSDIAPLMPNGSAS